MRWFGQLGGDLVQDKWACRSSEVVGVAMQALRLARARAVGAKGDGHAKKKGNHTCGWAWSVRLVMGPVQVGN